jgi:hypothetical protein
VIKMGCLEIQNAILTVGRLLQTPQPSEVIITSNSLPTPLPATPLANRTLIIIQNTGNTICNMSDSNGDLGIELDPGDIIRYPITPSDPSGILFYAILPSGISGTATLTIEEWVTE